MLVSWHYMDEFILSAELFSKEESELTSSTILISTGMGYNFSAFLYILLICSSSVIPYSW